MEISEPSRGYILEVFDAHFVLPNLGPIGTDTVIALDCFSFFCSCGSRKYLYPPQGGLQEIPRERGSEKAKCLDPGFFLGGGVPPRNGVN